MRRQQEENKYNLHSYHPEIATIIVLVHVLTVFFIFSLYIYSLSSPGVWSFTVQSLLVLKLIFLKTLPIIYVSLIINIKNEKVPILLLLIGDKIFLAYLFLLFY